MSRHRNIKEEQRSKPMRFVALFAIAGLIAAAITFVFVGAANADSVTPCPSEADVCEVPVIPAADWTVDDCNPEGVDFNAYWLLPEDADVEGIFDFRTGESNHLTVTLVSGYQTFPDGSVNHDYGTPEDSGVMCDSGPEEPISVTPTAPTTSEPTCDNTDLTVTPSSQDGVIWDPSDSTVLAAGDAGVLGESVTYIASPAEGYTFPEDAQTEWSFTNDFDVVTCVDNGPPPTDGGGTDNPDIDPPVIYDDNFGECLHTQTWFDNDHDGHVDKGECVKTASAHTGLGTAAVVNQNVSSDDKAPLWGLGLGVLLTVLGAYFAIFRPRKVRSE